MSDTPSLDSLAAELGTDEARLTADETAAQTVEDRLTLAEAQLAYVTACLRYNLYGSPLLPPVYPVEG